MFGRRKCVAINSALMFLNVCGILLPTNWVAEGISDFRLCADPQCQSIISQATGKITYRAGEEGMVSFKINSKIRVKSKSAGKDLNVWGIEVNGREGYAPKEYILEERVFVKDKDLLYTVPVVLPGSKKTNTASSPTAPSIKPSENIQLKKEDVEITTTAPLMSQLESNHTIPLTNPERNPTKEEIRQATPVQSEIEMIDGTIISDNTDKTEVPENSTEATEFEKLVPKSEKIFQEVDEKQNTSISEETTGAETQSPTLGSADNNSDVEVDDDDYDEEEDYTGKEDDPLVSEKDEKPSLTEEEVIENENNKSKSLLVDSEHERTKQKHNALLSEKPHLLISNEMENQKIEESSITLSGNTTVINASGGTEAVTDNPVVESPTLLKSQLPVSHESTSAEVSRLSTISDESGKEVPSESSETLPVPNTLAETTFSKVELQRNVSTETTTQLPSAGTAEEKVDDNDSNTEHNVPTLPIFQTPTQYQPQHQYIQEPQPTHSHADSQEHQHTHQYNSHDLHLDQTSIPETPHEITTKTEGTTSQQSGGEELLTPYYPQQIVEQTLKQPPTEAYFDETRNEIEPQKLETLPLLSGNDGKNKELIRESVQNISSVEEEKKSGHNTEENGQRGYADAGAVDENLTNTTPIHSLEVGTIKDIPQHSISLPPKEAFKATTSPSHPTIAESETITTAPHSPIEEHKTTTTAHHSPVEEHETTTTAPHLPIDEHETTTTAPHSPMEEHETTTTAQHSPVEEHETTTTAPHLPIDEHETTTNAPHSLIEEYERTTSVPHNVPEEETKEGLFATILGTVNNFLSNGKKEDESAEDEELHRILYPDRVKTSKKSKEFDADYCEKLSPNDCPSRVLQELNNAATTSSSIAGCQLDLNNMSMEMLLTVAGNKMFEMSELLACLATVAVTCLFFLFVYYCFCNSSREGELLAKLNALERSLLATHKENAILKEDLMGTRNKLSSIEDNSFGSNDMVIALKKELEEELLEKRQLQEQVGNLEKELENAAEAGLELNKIVSELLNNQTGDESIISSVEELQKQLNEQQKTILDINANLAEKSRENSELQLMIAEQNARLSGEIASLQQDNDELEVEKSNLQTRLEEVKREFEEDITKALEGKNFEIKRLQSELVDLGTKLEAEHTKYQTSLAKVEALEECLRTVRRDPSVNINNIIDVANVRAELLDVQKRYAALKERLDTETDGKKLCEQQLHLASSENEKLKHDFHQSEKDKLEAQTRLEVLSNYFKEKEIQLQKELSLKEAMWLKQQGETTSTVDRVTTMQEEIQALKSQNDALRAEIEAQLAAHKAQTGTLENRAHETWLAARQSERRYEEARAEATALRRKLTSLAGGATGEVNFEKIAAGELNNAPSPIHMESPGSPLMGRLPPPPFLPPPFMGPAPPFMGMPPPFVPPGEMRPPPLGRLMSPPPGAVSGGSGGSGHLPPPRRGLYSPNRTDYDDYDDDEDEDDYVDDEDDEDEEEERMRQHRRRRGSDINGSWHRDDSYSPPPRAYRSQSPTDSRYNYNTERDLISTYDTETDFEQSPRKHERRGARGSHAGSYRDYSPPPSASSPLNVSSNSNAGKKHTASVFNKGHMSSGSEKSYNTPAPRHGSKKSSKSAV